MGFDLLHVNYGIPQQASEMLCLEILSAVVQLLSVLLFASPAENINVPVSGADTHSS